MPLQSKLAGAVAAILFAASSQAALVIDQQQTDASAYMAGFVQPDLAQSFQQSHNNIAGAGIHLQSGIGVTDTVTISLWDMLPNQVGASKLASGSGLATSGTDFDVFWSPVAITAGNTYFLEFTSANDALGIAGAVNDPYGFGQVYANSGFGSFPDFDYTFRTWYDDGGVQGNVPEPGSLALLGLGMLGAALVRRRGKA